MNECGDRSREPRCRLRIGLEVKGARDVERDANEEVVIADAVTNSIAASPCVEVH